MGSCLLDLAWFLIYTWDPGFAKDGMEDPAIFELSVMGCINGCAE